jgi:hypothetical protein
MIALNKTDNKEEDDTTTWFSFNFDNEEELELNRDKMHIAENRKFVYNRKMIEEEFGIK